jgi:organic radical activating enzyme
MKFKCNHNYSNVIDKNDVVNPDVYELVVTRLCNWSCIYCSEDCNNYPEDIDTSIIDNIIDSEIPDNSLVRLSGGEVGVLNSKRVVNIINKLEDKNCQLELNTNGLFMKKYPHYISKFNRIIWHVSEDLKPLKIDTSLLHDNIEPMIVVSDKIFKRLDDFMKVNEDVMLNVVASDLDFCDCGNDTLSEDNIKLLIRKNYKNMTRQSKLELLGTPRKEKVKFL